ncbi:MAG: sodium ion-translocating decarboxylase subunit beta, partial [Puniceicoccales bacterium]|nr:sodium ion-translocating decarboxylase subunit beta [Puniceicoccales bacterium]
MEQITDLISLTGFPALFANPGMFIMWVVVAVLFYFAVFKQFEPLLLVPIAFGALLANIPSENLVEKPAGDLISTYSGTVIATTLEKGTVFKVPQVIEEIPEHLSRKNEAGIKALFEREAARRTLETNKNTGSIITTGLLGAVVRPEGVSPTPDQLIEVPWLTLKRKSSSTAGKPEYEIVQGTLQVCDQDKVFAVPATGDVSFAVGIGDKITKGENLGKLYNSHAGGLYHWLSLGVILEIFPPLIFLGIGAMTDFGPLIANPKTLLLGAAAQLGVFTTFLAANMLFGFTPQESAAIGIIGGADGPTSIFLANKLAPDLMAAIAVAAYSYMALVPLIQPPIMKALTTQHERKIRMT